MKHYYILFLALYLFSCSGNQPNEEIDIKEDNQITGVEFDDYNQKISYCIGLDHGRGAFQAFSSENVKDAFDIREIRNGMIDYLMGNEVRIQPWEKDSLIELYLLPDGQVNSDAVSKIDASYCVGMDEAFTLISSLVARKIDQIIDVEFMTIGVNEGMSNMDYPTIAYMDARREVGKYYSDLNLENGKDFLAENLLVEGVVETESGLQYKIIEEGFGVSPNLTDSVTMHYTGRFIDGRVFDSTVPSNTPYTNTLLNLVQGWQEGLLMMNEGGQRRLYIPSYLAYGPEGMGVVEPNSTLVFDIELLKVSRFQSP
jgi:FKBP-type peptidyl-prolyl cis-trans isomerase FklB